MRSHPLYSFARSVLVGFARVYWRLSVEGKQNVPRSGPYIVAPVHRSNVDFVAAAAITRRRLRYMGKDSLWRVPVLREFITALGAFPVHRGSADREALRRCLEVLNEEEPLVLFPEGTRKSGPAVHEMFEGAAYLSIRAGVPVVPVGIGGSEAAMPRGSKWLRPVKIHVVVGELIEVQPAGEGERVSRRAAHRVTSELHEALQALFDHAQAKAAGLPPGAGG